MKNVNAEKFYDSPFIIFKYISNSLGLCELNNFYTGDFCLFSGILQCLPESACDLLSLTGRKLGYR
jgi:hypothetical protein